MVLRNSPSQKAYVELYHMLSKNLPAAHVLRDPVSLLAFGSDASFYRLTPKLVVKVFSEQEAAFVLASCHALQVPVTARAAGTSLSGQAISDSVILQIAREFNSAMVLENGKRIRLQPAVVGSTANRLLAPFARKLGPDPASIDAAMIGGIAANNASGMCCGVSQNCYHTLISMRLVLADGTILDTSQPESRQQFTRLHGKLLEAITLLAVEVQQDTDLKALIKRKYAMKNTMGYSLNALVDFRDPFEVLQHLLIGSEGTLGFISEITLHTIPEPMHKAAILAFFPDEKSVGQAVQALANVQVQAVEYMDASSLQSVAHHPEIALANLLSEKCSALLIDIRADLPNELLRLQNEVLDVVTVFSCIGQPVVASHSAQYQALWSIRKGLFPAIGATRPSGTTIIIEDVAFPMQRLSEAMFDLRELLNACGYAEAIIYGHALSGNLHFVFAQNFALPEEVARYADFIDKLTTLVVDKYQGSLKAEHGTGRNMAPFVEKEWGERAYAVMARIKFILDPRGILNPDVILSRNAHLHLQNLKPMPSVHPLIDPCVECGFCEKSCPSRNTTLTPRQRITVSREISRLGMQHDDRKQWHALKRGFDYQGDKTCATDGMCAIKCPVGIDTGRYIKFRRHLSKSVMQDFVANRISKNFGLTLHMLRFGLLFLQSVRNTLGTKHVANGLRRLSKISCGIIPAGLEFLPRPGRATSLPPSNRSAPLRVLYFPSCINRAFGPERQNDAPLSEIMVALLHRAGFEVVLPEGVNQLCCGLPFSSKGFAKQGDRMLQETRAVIEVQGKDCVAVVCDTSPCTQRLMENASSSLAVYDSLSFLETHVLPRLQVNRRKRVVAIHPTCSATKMGWDRSLEVLASACAEKIVKPYGVPCCGVAGDRIFSVPELPQSACAGLRKELPQNCYEGYSSSRTCEIGLSAASGITYRSILYLLYETTLPINHNKEVHELVFSKY